MNGHGITFLKKQLLEGKNCLQCIVIPLTPCKPSALAAERAGVELASMTRFRDFSLVSGPIHLYSLSPLLFAFWFLSFALAIHTGAVALADIGLSTQLFD